MASARPATRPRLPSGTRCRARARQLLAACLLAAAATRAAGAAESLPILDVQALRVLHIPASWSAADSLEVDIAICGGGLAGIAAALAACEAGYLVVLSEETDWLGGQLTAQGVAAFDESPCVERCGSTRSYQALRSAIRDVYRRDGRLRPAAAADPHLNPGNCWVGTLACEPRVALQCLEAMLAPQVAAGRLIVLHRHKLLRVGREGNRLQWLDLVHLDAPQLLRVRASLFLDATELGDLLPMAGAACTWGAESSAETGEPSAPASARLDCVQAFTYPFVLERRPGGRHVIPEPAGYAANRLAQPFSHRIVLPDERFGRRYALLRLDQRTPNLGGSFWTYRRLIDSSLFVEGTYASDRSLINWPAIDYRGGNLLDGDPDATLAQLVAARALSLGFLHWLQTEAPHADGAGHPELWLDREALGTSDGLARHPYIREARRARTRQRLREQDLSAAANPGSLRGPFHADAIGVGAYPIDIHPGPCAELPLVIRALPFQIPLGVLVLDELVNLIPAGKSAGCTRLASAATRTHAVEWTLGEAAGGLAGFCLAAAASPQAVHADPDLVRRLQAQLVGRGVPIYWYRDLTTTDLDFVSAQLAPFGGDDARSASERSLDFRAPRP
jgi:hypothetical protein